MTRTKVYFGVLILALVAIIIWASYGMFHVGKKEETHLVSVIVNDSNNERWTALRQGLEQAAKDYNIDMNYVFTGRLNSVEEEMALIIRERDNGAEGIIVQMVAGVEEPDEMAGLSVRTPMILLESGVNPEGVYAYAGPDNRELGRAVADAVKRDFEENTEDKTIGILCGSQAQLAMQQRLQGLLEGLEEETAVMEFSAEICWILEKEDLLNRKAEEQLETVMAVDIVIALGNDETEQVVDYIGARENDDTCLLYGVGCSEKAVYYLDKGIIKTLVVPNEFNMGYQSMETMANMLQYHLTEAQDSYVGYLVIDRTNMYDAENQKILFPIVQ